MPDRILRWLALFSALVLSLCVLDTAFVLAVGKAAPSPVLPVVRFDLTLRVAQASAFPNDKKWNAEIVREERRLSPAGRAERVYLTEKSLELRGKDPTKVSLKEGTYWIIARAPGFSRVSERIDLHAALEREIQFTEASSLEVTVLGQKDEDQIPLAQATVLVGGADELPLGAATDAKGMVRFSEVPSGPRRVRIFAPGYEPYEAMAERELLVRLRPASILRVTVTKEGVVAPDAQVFIAGANLWPARVVVTGDKGFIDISGLKPGRFALYAEKGALVSEVKTEVEVSQRAERREVTLELLPGEFVPIKVLARESEKAIEGARVTWSSVGIGQFSRHEFTDGKGLVRVGPLTRPEGVLSIRAEGFVPRVVPVERVDEREEGSEFQIVRLERSGTIEGRVVDPDGFPVAGATIEVAGTDIYAMPVSITHLRDEISDAHFDWAEDLTNVLIPAGELGVMLGPVPPIPLSDVPVSEGRRLTTDEKGYFLARDVPPGELVVLARHPAFMDGRSAVLKLGPGAHKKTEIVLGRGERLRGRVLDHQEFPVKYARIQVSARGFDRRVTAEEDGTFELEAAPRDVTLRVSRLERPLQVLLASEVKKTERDTEIVLKLPAPREPAQILVADAAGEPVPLAQVTILSLDRKIPFKNTRFTNDEGRVEFDESVGLRTRVEVASPGHVQLVQEKVLKKENTLKLVTALSARGRVTAVRGRRVAEGASIVIKSGRVTRTAFADDLGEYRLTGLPPGMAEISGRHEEYGSGKLRLNLKADAHDREIELPDLDLSPHVEITGLVVDEAGRPVPGALISADRIGPYVPLGASLEILAESNEAGEFRVEVARQEPLYLYGASLGRLFGFSDALSVGDQDRVSDARIILDRRDKVPPDGQGTVLIALEASEDGIGLYSVAPDSQAERAGLEDDDVVLEIDGMRPEDVKDARELLSGVPGSDVRILIERGAGRMELVTSREAFRRSGTK
jgi:hypothetical protein